MKEVLRFGVGTVLALTLVGLGTQGGQAADWKPKSNVTFIVGAAPGGANDRIARSIQQVIQEEHLIDTSMTIDNRPGAGQVVAVNYLASKAKDPNYLCLVSATFFSTIAQSQSPLMTQVTPLMKLFDDYQAYFVKKDSAIKDVADLKQRVKANPEALTFSFSVGLGSPLHVSVANMAQEVGVDPKRIKTVVFNSGTEVAAQVAGGHVDVGISSIGSAMPLVDAGESRYIGIASPKRLGGPLANVPTMREQGVNVITAIYYTVLAPKGITPEQAAFWTNVLDRVVKSKTMRDILDREQWESNPVRQPELGKYLDDQYNGIRKTLIDIGFVK